MTVILAMNEKDTLPDAVAIADLHDVLTEAKPDLGVLQEWPKSRDEATDALCARLGYGYARPAKGGGPALWRLADYHLRTITAHQLVGGELVGHLPGRRDRLGPSIATVAMFDGPQLGNLTKTCLIGYHLTAEVQDVRGGGGYKKDPAHLLRVLRHRREKWALGRLGRRHALHDAVTWMGGDTNYAGMQIHRFTNCWDGFKGGDLGGRPVTVVYHTRHPNHAPRLLKTRSDHDAVIVTYV